MKKNIKFFFLLRIRTYVHSRPAVRPGHFVNNLTTKFDRARTNICSVLLINVKIVAFPLHFCYNVITKDKKGENKNVNDYICALGYIRFGLCRSC